MSAVMTAGQSATSADAISLLVADHDKAKNLFTEYERIKETGSAEEKFEIAKQVCGALLIHMAIEEALFYPPVRKAIADKGLVKDGEEEHEEAKDLIRKLGDIDPSDAEFDEKMKELSELVSHHVKDEEEEMFPQVRDTDLDLIALGEELKEARNAMRTNLGLQPES